MLKDNKIQIRYDRLENDDTLNLEYDNKTGVISDLKDDWDQWIKTEGEETDVDEKGLVDSSILDDNISVADKAVADKAAADKAAADKAAADKVATDKAAAVQAPVAPKSVEKKKETSEEWIIRKYQPEQISKLKKNFDLGEKSTNSDLVKAVKKFQKEHNLVEDGKPGTNTIKMITKLRKHKEETEKPLDVTKLSLSEITKQLDKYVLATKKPLSALTLEEKRTILEAINSGKDLPKRAGTVTQENMKSNSEVIGVIDLPSVNGDVTGVYSESSFGADLSQTDPILIESGIAKKFPKTIDDNGYYKLQKGNKLVIVTGERLKKIFKIEKGDDEVSKKEELNIDNLGIDFSKLDINVKEENIRIEGGKYIIDIDGLGDNLTLEQVGNDKFKITDNSDNISDIIISKGEIVEATTLLNNLVQTKFMHKAYDKSHKVGGNLTSEGKKIKILIDSVRTPSNLSEFKKKIEALREEVFPEEKK